LNSSAILNSVGFFNVLVIYSILQPQIIPLIKCALGWRSAC
jgi:hypothetical protein